MGGHDHMFRMIRVSFIYIISFLRIKCKTVIDFISFSFKKLSVFP
uniref:Uncharacterized protein n=1 Tax=Anguilla anguilla TaxID=7936 RepID=A0A0E9VY03_ANGAN